MNFALFSLKGHAVVLLHLLLMMMLARCCWDPVVGMPGMLFLLLLLLAKRMADKTAGRLMRVKHLLLLLSADVQSEQMLAAIGGRS